MPNPEKLKAYVGLKEVKHDRLGNPILIYKRTYMTAAERKNLLAKSKEFIAKKVEDAVDLGSKKEDINIGSIELSAADTIKDSK